MVTVRVIPTSTVVMYFRVRESDHIPKGIEIVLNVDGVLSLAWVSALPKVSGVTVVGWGSGLPGASTNS